MSKLQIDIKLLEYRHEIIDQYNEMTDEKNKTVGYFGETKNFLYCFDEIRDAVMNAEADISICKLRNKINKYIALDEMRN